jgi:hypothetical protein
MMATKQCMEQVAEFVVVLVNGQENSLSVLKVSIIVEFVVVLVNGQV